MQATRIARLIFIEGDCAVSKSATGQQRDETPVRRDSALRGWLAGAADDRFAGLGHL
ncbi:hypothetical protein ACFQ09_19150 [Massilia norwichensis]|uniref:Uncharacterized protein n=1 Tax=Massilia norwichensis TaxID=1442366 RepID=A0ABT2AC80_9BURK|nr:hypothetical protein [Massilia norwichensis]MCS0591767.1 hypothetical protein [Massilia norwichensis]